MVQVNAGSLYLRASMRVTCPACSNLLNVPDTAAGQSGQCPFCGLKMSWPTADEMPVVIATLVEERSAEADVDDVYGFAHDGPPKRGYADPAGAEKLAASSA